MPAGGGTRKGRARALRRAPSRSTRSTARAVLRSRPVQRTARRYSTPHLAHRVLGSRGVQRTARSYGRAASRGRRVLSSRQVQRVGRQGQRQLARQVLLQSLISGRGSRAALRSFAPSFVAGIHRASTSTPTLPGRSSKNLQTFTPTTGPTGGRGPVGTPRGPKHLTSGAPSLSRGLNTLGGVLHHLANRQTEQYIRSQTNPNQTIRALAHPGRLLSSAAKVGVHSQLEQASGGRLHFQDVPHIDPKKLVIDTPRALVEHPKAIGKTLKDLAMLPVSGPAGVVGAITDPVKAYHYFAADTNRRYRGSAAAYRKRIGKEGAAAELTDALAVGTPEASVLGRGLGQVARRGALGPRARRFASEVRPRLRTSGNVTHAQDLSPNLFRASLQRAEDRRRAARTAKLNRKHPTAKPGLQPRGGRRPSGRPHEVVPLFQKRAQRVEASRVQSRNYQAFRHQHHQEVGRGAQQAISRLNRHQQRAVFHTLQGLVKLDDPARAVEQLLARRARIEAAWRKSGVEKPPPELKTIDYLVRHADKVFTTDLVKFHAGELQRAGRVGHVGVSSHVAEARRYRPQARELGVDYTYHKLRDQVQADAKRALARTKDKNEAARIKQRRDQQLDELAQRRPELDRQFVADVKSAAAAHGLPEPVYVQHFKHQSAAQAEEGLPGAAAQGRAAHALGGSRAAPGVKQSEMRLFDTGRADTSSQAYVQSVARTVKRGHNWRAMAEQVDTHAFPNPTPSELEAAFGHKHVDPRQLTADEWKTILTHRGVDHSEYALWSPGKFQREVTHAAAQDAQHGSTKTGTHDAVEMQGAFESSAGPAEQAVDKFGRDQGVRLIPREVYNELHATIKSASAAGRFIDKLQGVQSSVLLGTNPSWLQIQIGANAFLAAFGTRGNVADFLKAPLFMRQLKKKDPALVEALNDLMGTGVGEAHARNARLGAAANNRVVDGYRAVRAAVSFKATAAKNAVPLLRDVPTLNPVHVMFSIDNAQNRYFKRVVLYNKVKRQAFRDMATEGGTAFRLQGQIAHLLSLGPKARIEAIMRDPQLLERHAQAVDNVLGNYVRYTARERATFKRYVLFYGFMRYSLRTLLYTLPVKHPIVASVVSKLAQLHNQEVKDLIGENAPPWVFASIYMDTKIGKDGRMMFTDPDVRAGRKPPRTIGLSRLNPVTNPLVDLVTEGPKALGSFISPVLQIALNQMYGRNLFTHRDYEPGTSGWRRVANELGQLAFPYRAALRATQPGPSKYYKSDTLLFSPRPKHYKTPAKRAEMRRAIKADKAAGSLLPQLLPFVPKRDFTAQGAKQRQHQLSKKKHGGGGNLFGPAGGGGGGGGSGSFMAPHPRLHGPGVRLAGLEAQHIAGLGFANPQALGGLLAGQGVRQRGRGPVHHASGLPKIASDVLAGSVANAGTFHTGRFPTRPHDPGILAPKAAHLMSAEARFMPLARFLNKPPLVPLAQLRPHSKLRLFAHPQRAGTGKAGRVQLGKVAAAATGIAAGVQAGFSGKPVPIKGGQFVLPAKLTGATRPLPTVAEIKRHGVRGPQGSVVLHPKVARQLIKVLNDRGYGNRQIQLALTSPKPTKALKKLGAPAQLVAAASVLKHVKNTGAAVPSGVPAQYKGPLAKWGHLADAEARKHGLPNGATLLAKILKGESNFNMGSVSSAGARGAAQFMPGTRDSYKAKYGVDAYAGPDGAVHAAALYMQKGGGLAAYNPGMSSYSSYILGQNVGKSRPTAKLTSRQKRAVKIVQRAHKAGQKIPKHLRRFVQHNAPPGMPSPSTSAPTSTGVSTTSSAAAANANAPTGGGGSTGRTGAGGSSPLSLGSTSAASAADQQAATILQGLITRGHGQNSPLLTSGLLSILFPGATLPSSFTQAGTGAGGSIEGVPLLSVLLDELNRPGRKRSLVGV